MTCYILGHPTIYIRPRLENSTDHDGNLKHLVYNIERAVACMNTLKTDDEKLSLLIDCKGYSLINAPPLKTCIAAMSIVQDHYPERLYRAYIMNAPWIFNVFFQAVSPFIQPLTKSKVC